MAKKDYKKLLSQIVVILFLIMVVLGFTIPSFGDDNDSSNVQQRVCQADADCYLDCDSGPVQSLCWQNMCVQNSCDQESIFPFENEVKIFNLIISVNGSNLNLESMSNPNNVFVKFFGDKVSLFSSGLSLEQILEKVNARLDNQCLTVNLENYCRSDETSLDVFVNDEQVYSYNQMVPKEGDKVEIVYG
jgi:hypothetical protein